MTANTEPMIDDPVAELERIFDFETVGPDHLRTQPLPVAALRLYGGQVVAQALAAIQRTSPPDRFVHSCHCYFVRPGTRDLPIDFILERDRDGRSFSARRVQAMQGGELILSMSASLGVPEPGYDWPDPVALDVPGPETLRPMSEYIAEAAPRMAPHHHPFWLRDHPVDWRPVEEFPIFDGDPLPPCRHFWIRMKRPLGDDPRVHQCFFAYASDLHILSTGLLPLGLGFGEPTIQMASLDHAIWFHRPFRADEWFLYRLEAESSRGARTLSRGKVFTPDGVLVASVAQEGLARVLPVERPDRK